MLDQPIPANPIRNITAFELLVKPIKRYDSAIIARESKCTFLLPYFVEKIPIGIETKKQTRFKTAKHIDEK